MTLFRVWVAACDTAGCDARCNLGAFMREPEARWAARDLGWEGYWHGPWHCPDHVADARLPFLRPLHEGWCPAAARDGYEHSCACRPHVETGDEAEYWVRSDMAALPRRVSNLRLPRTEGEDDDGATGPPVTKPGHAV